MDSTTSWAQVVDYLMNEIANRNLNPGDKLPPERTMAADLNVSRATVREAIKVMNYLGFIDSTQGSGNFIAERYSETVANIMRVMYLRGDISFEGLTQFRQMLEINSFDLAVKNATVQQKLEMQQIVDLLDTCTDDSLIVDLDNRFHTLLAEASDNRLIIINFYALSRVLNEYMFNTYHYTVSKKKDGFKQLQIYHHAIIDALIEGNIDKGHQAIRSHFSHLDRA